MDNSHVFINLLNLKLQTKKKQVKEIHEFKKKKNNLKYYKEKFLSSHEVVFQAIHSLTHSPSDA